MKRKYIKEILRDIFRSKSRFIAIIAIVTLGAGFFGGIKSTSVDMKLTADDYYKKTNLMDFRVMSTLGITDEDIAALRELDGVSAVMPAYRSDAIVTANKTDSASIATDSVFRFHSLSDDQELNKIEIVEGRLPQNINECVLLVGSDLDDPYSIGEHIKLDIGLDPDIVDELTVTEFEVVGFATSSMYISTVEREATNKGSGVISTTAFVLDDVFDMEVYPEAYLTLNNVDNISSFGNEYKSKIEDMERSLKAFGKVQSINRYDDVIGEANAELADARKEFEDEKADAVEKLADAEQTIADAKTELADGGKKLADARVDVADGKIELTDGEKELEENIIEFDDKMAEAVLEFADAKKEIDENEEKLEQGWSDYRSGSSKLSEGQSQYQQGLSQYQQAKTQFDASPPEYQQSPAGQATSGMLSATKSQLDSAKSQLDSGSSSLSEGYRTLYFSQRELDKGKDEYKEKYQEFVDKRAEAQEEIYKAQIELADGKQKLIEGERDIIKGEKEIADAKTKLYDGEKEYLEKKAEADEKIVDAEIKLADAQDEINDIEEPTFYVLDRDDIKGVASFGQDADRIDGVAVVFPVFFFLVAALVCLTSMTRMIEEQRTQIGVLKAMGYTKLDIMGKYLFYAFATCIVGSVAGLTIGFTVFPRVIWDAYGMMYDMPAIQTPWNNKFAITAIFVFLLCTVGSTILAGYSELLSPAAHLIRPKPPKSGKRIFLERITPLWKRMSFTHKLTARNILRYKRRFFMTIIGIAGCTALMLTGFGLKDSISGIVENQYGKLLHHDVQITMSHKLDEDESKYTLRQKEALNNIHSDGRITDSILTYQENVTALSTDSTVDLGAYVYVPQDTERVTDFVTFRERRGHEAIEFPEKGAIVTEKLATELNLGVGGSFTFKDTDHNEFSLTVAGICENYVYNYIYISPAQYEETFGKDIMYQSVMAKVTDEALGDEDTLSYDLLKNKEIVNVNFTSSLMSNFDNMLGSLDSVMVILILSASLLAFIVLYNLTNINIAERMREIATIKVLGFYNREVDGYIYRENMILTLFGTLCGFALGVFLHQFVMRVAEVNMVMFGRVIHAPSYLWAGLLTFLFSLIVNFAVHFKLKKINMVESLKSVE